MYDIDSIILFGAGLVGKRALKFFGLQAVHCFVDNNNFGTFVIGKNVIPFDEFMRIHQNYTTIVSVGMFHIDEVRAQLDKNNVKYLLFDEQRDKYYTITKNYFPIKRFEKAYDGQKCFLAGNGSSLRATDLEKVRQKGYKTFGCNLINKMFDKTDWRPDFYCCVENSLLHVNKDFILGSSAIDKFIPALVVDECDFFLCKNDMRIYSFMYPGISDKFSKDCSQIVYSGLTVMYVMIQIAVYMGFTDIYLIGVDNTQPPSPHTSNFNNLNAHFYDENPKENNLRKELYKPIKFDDDWEKYQGKCNSDYQLAKDYADSQNIKIFNATRGGLLEVFERINIDDLF